jgi:hypothetical protein
MPRLPDPEFARHWKSFAFVAILIVYSARLCDNYPSLWWLRQIERRSGEGEGQRAKRA